MMVMPPPRDDLAVRRLDQPARDRSPAGIIVAQPGAERRARAPRRRAATPMSVNIADAMAHQDVGVGERRAADAVVGMDTSRIILSGWRITETARARDADPSRRISARRAATRTASRSVRTSGCSCSSWRSAAAPTPSRWPTRSTRAAIAGVLYEDVNDPRGIGAADVQRGSRRTSSIACARC